MRRAAKFGFLLLASTALCLAESGDDAYRALGLKPKQKRRSRNDGDSGPKIGDGFDLMPLGMGETGVDGEGGPPHPAWRCG